MSDTTHLSRLAAAQEFLSHMGRGDVGAASGLLSDQVVYRSPGHNALSGVFTGPQAVVAHLMNLARKTSGTFDAFKWDDWMIGQHHVAGLTTVHAQADGRRYRGHHLILVTFNAADKIEGIAIFFEDQGAIDRFIGP